MFLKIVSCCGIVLSCCLSSRIDAQTTKVSVDKQHISGVAQAHFAGLMGWRTGDLLIRFSTTGDGQYLTDREFVEGPDAMSIAVREDYLSRVVFDFDLERALVVNRFEREVRMFNALDEEVRQPEISVDRRVLLHDKTADIVLHKTQAGVIEQTRELLPIRSNLALMGVPSLQCWGWGESASWDLDTMRREIEFNNDVHNMASFENVGKNVYRVVAQDLEGTRRGFTGQYVTDWDMQRNVPIKFVAHHASPSKYEPAETTSVKWRSIDDFFIPESARTSRRSMETIAGLRFHLREEISFEVHWFSFNSELSKELFSEELLRDRRKLDELLNTDVFEDNSKPPQIREGN